MGSLLLLITGDSGLFDRLGIRFDGALAATAWPEPGQMPCDVLVIDAAAAVPSIWHHLERLSRDQNRPSIILLDDGKAPREHLARVAADCLLSVDACTAEIAARIEEYMSDYAFRAAATHIRAQDAIPYPLVRFLAAAFTERFVRVGILARSLGISQSTVSATNGGLFGRIRRCDSRTYCAGSHCFGRGLVRRTWTGARTCRS